MTAIVKQVCSQLKEAGADAEDIDMLVHDVKSNEATDINNKGVEAQVKYLLASGWSAEQILDMIMDKDI